MRRNGTGQGPGQKDEEGGTCGHWIPGLMVLGFSPTRRGLAQKCLECPVGQRRPGLCSSVLV